MKKVGSFQTYSAFSLPEDVKIRVPLTTQVPLESPPPWSFSVVSFAKNGAPLTLTVPRLLNSIEMVVTVVAPVAAPVSAFMKSPELVNTALRVPWPSTIVVSPLAMNWP
jgi:hypothetical protein